MQCRVCGLQVGTEVAMQILDDFPEFTELFNHATVALAFQVS